MSRTTTKGVRLTDVELQRVEQLRAHFPEYSSDADLLRHATLLGVMVLATYVPQPEVPPYANYRPEDLVALLKPRLMPAIDFLIERGALPKVFPRQTADDLQVRAIAGTQQEQGDEVAIDEAVAGDLEGLGSHFMDD
jgi:hypothetical protein